MKGHINMAKKEDVCDQVTLTLEDNSELLCDILAIYPCDGKDYIALIPADGDDDSDIFLYRFEGNGGNEEDMKLIDIESDEEFEAASDAFYELLDAEEFDELMDDEEDGE